MAEAGERIAVTPGDNLSAVLREYMEVTDRLQRTHQTLQREVVRLREELAGKDRELELRRRLAALGELAAGVAHEVRNPLGAIQLYSGLLRKKLVASGASPDVFQCSRLQLGPALALIEKIEAGIQAIEAVVQDTLALVPRDRRLAVCRLKDIVARAGDAALKTLTVCRVKLEVRYEDENVCVRVDEDGFQRVLINLIVNAAEASPPGRAVRVQVGRASPPASAAACQEVEVRVLDEGGGLPEEIRHRIFDPFFTTKQQGTGLGLTIAHRLIEAYGGRIRAGNRPEGGAEFVLSLPRVEVPARADARELDERQFSAA